jgi:hypothetical protein
VQCKGKVGWDAVFSLSAVVVDVGAGGSMSGLTIDASPNKAGYWMLGGRVGTAVVDEVAAVFVPSDVAAVVEDMLFVIACLFTFDDAFREAVLSSISTLYVEYPGSRC